MLDDGKSELRQTWAEVVSGVFNGAVPAKAEWTNPTDIVLVLNAISTPVNHMFYPEGGGMDIRGARLNSKGELEWAVEEGRLDSYGHEANFVLECGPLKPQGDYAGHSGYAEELTELSNGSFESRSTWDEGAPEGARLVTRYVRSGRFVIFGKGSIYNSFQDRGFDAYDAFHNDAGKFEKVVEEMANIKLA